MISLKRQADRRPSRNGQDIVVLHCAVCQQNSVELAIEIEGDKSEPSVWAATRKACGTVNWTERDGKVICPVCASRKIERLPAFSGLASMCAKCRTPAPNCVYEEGGGPHLRRTCASCGFAWNEACADVPMKKSRRRKKSILYRWTRAILWWKTK